jgi:hypothetical protein
MVARTCRAGRSVWPEHAVPPRSSRCPRCHRRRGGRWPDRLDVGPALPVGTGLRHVGLRAQAEGWNLVVLDLGLDLNSPQGRFTAHELCAAAQLERELISRRTKDALAAAEARCIHVGLTSKVPTDVVATIPTCVMPVPPSRPSPKSLTPPTCPRPPTPVAGTPLPSGPSCSDRELPSSA